MSRILFILHLPPPVHGSSMVGYYIKESQAINEVFQCKFINLSTSRTMDEMGKKPLQKIGRYFLILFNVMSHLIFFRPHLVYLALTAKGPAFYKDSVIALLAKLFQKKIVYHFHNKGVSTCQNYYVDNYLYKKVFNNSYFILLSKYLYPDIKKYVNKTEVFFCPNGIPAIEFDKYLADKDTSLSLKYESCEILFLSNLIESKGVFVLINACKILLDRHIPFHCTFIGGIGDVTEEQFNIKVKELGLEKHILFAGKKYGDEKKEYFLQADIFVFPTYYEYETFGLVNLEAMQFSLPIISTFEGGIPEIIENEVTGFLIPQRNAEILAEKLELLITNPKLRIQMGEAGREKYLREYTLQNFEDRLIEILERIILK